MPLETKNKTGLIILTWGTKTFFESDLLSSVLHSSFQITNIFKIL